MGNAQTTVELQTHGRKIMLKCWKTMSSYLKTKFISDLITLITSYLLPVTIYDRNLW